jgi:hypothetical protein
MKTLISLIILIASIPAYSQQYSRITYDAGTNLDIGPGANVCAGDIIIQGTYSGTGTICDGVMPVMMLSFTALVDKNNARLSWTTENEINNSGFDIERRIFKPGAQWQKVAFVQGSGTTTEAKSYSYYDKKLQTGKYEYRLKQIDYSNNFEYFNLENPVDISGPKDFKALQNYPNPSNPKSKIDYEIPLTAKVTIKIYDILGREVVTLVNEVKEAGYYSAEFDGSSLASGVYFYKLTAGDYSATKKMLLVK